MEKMRELQTLLKTTGRYVGEVDGLYGPMTCNAILAAMEDGPDSALTLQDYVDSGGRLGCSPAYVLAMAEVEAAGAGFFDGSPKLLFEPHRFCKLTAGRFNLTNPKISYWKWGAKPYPKTQDERYRQLLEAIGCDVTAGFSAASYGKFQIMGENYEAAGYDTPYEFAFAMAYDEPTQLKAYESFIRHAGILHPLQNGNWAVVAKLYNGAAYAKNRYDVKLAQAARKWELKLEASG